MEINEKQLVLPVTFGAYEDISYMQIPVKNSFTVYICNKPCKRFC